MPKRFNDPDHEYRAVRQQAGLIDCSVLGLLEVGGADRGTFLHNILTNDIKSLAPGSGCQAGLVTASAKLLADLLVLADDERHWLLVQRSRAEVVLKTLERYLITEDVALRDHTQTSVLLALQGSTSIATLSRALGTPITFQQALDHRVVTLDSVPIRAIAYSLTGEPGAILAVVAENAAWLWERLRRHGAQPVGWEALNVLRIEAGLPWYGLDMDETTLLPETGLEERLVSYTKGCYVGQEIIARLQTYGSVSRKLMGLVFEGQEMPQAHDPITKAGEQIGEITSACFSPALNRPIAMGYVKRPFYEVGTAIVVKRDGKELPAKLVKRPFIKK